MRQRPSLAVGALHEAPATSRSGSRMRTDNGGPPRSPWPGPYGDIGQLAAPVVGADGDETGARGGSIVCPQAELFSPGQIHGAGLPLSRRGDSRIARFLYHAANTSKKAGVCKKHCSAQIVIHATAVLQYKRSHYQVTYIVYSRLAGAAHRL